MQTTKIILGLGFAILLVACSQEDSISMKQNPIMADSTSNAFISSAAAIENTKDSTRRFIRTADLKFKVKSVIKSTYDIENITTQHGGFVTYTNLKSDMNNVTITAVSADSSLETTYFTVSNLIVLRVPNTKLDTTLREISRNIDYLDHRIIKAEDISLSILANDLTQKRASKNEERLTNAIDNRGKKLNETANAEEMLSNKQEQADKAKISNLSLNDQIAFSTINLFIYQRQDIKSELISNYNNIDAFEPSFGAKILEALKFGWDILESFIILLTKLWSPLLLVFLLYFILKKYSHKLKKTSGQH